MSSSLINDSKDKIINLVDFIENKYNDFKNTEILGMPIDTGMDIISDVNTGFQIIKSIYKSYQKITFSKFLKGLSSQINSKNKLTEKEKIALNKYLSQDENIHFIFNTIKKSLNANSLKCTELLAIISGSLIKNQKEIDMNTIIIIDALASMNDFDLSNFFYIYKHIVTSEDYKHKRVIRLDKLYSEVGKRNVSISVNKLINYQIFDQRFKTVNQGLRFSSPEPDQLMENDEIFIQLNSASDDLYSIIKFTNWY